MWGQKITERKGVPFKIRNTAETGEKMKAGGHINQPAVSSHLKHLTPRQPPDTPWSRGHHSVHSPPLGHLGLQEGQAQPLHELHPKLPEQGLVAVAEPAVVQALENSGSCEHSTSCSVWWEGFVSSPKPTNPT